MVFLAMVGGRRSNVDVDLDGNGGGAVDAMLGKAAAAAVFGELKKKSCCYFLFTEPGNFSTSIGSMFI